MILQSLYSLYDRLASDPAYADTLRTLQTEMDTWLNQIGDNPELSERDLIDKLWNGKASKPKTADPEITLVNGLVELSSSTPGASISYKIIQNNYEPKTWDIYTGPFVRPDGSALKIEAHRIGYQPSQIMTYAGLGEN